MNARTKLVRFPGAARYVGERDCSPARAAHVRHRAGAARNGMLGRSLDARLLGLNTPDAQDEQAKRAEAPHHGFGIYGVISGPTLEQGAVFLTFPGASSAG